MNQRSDYRLSDLKQWRRALRSAGLVAAFGMTTVVAGAQTIQWGLTVVNINNPITPTVVTNADGSISITAGGGDTYSKPDSFTFAYQQVTGDFDIRVRVMDVSATDPAGQDSPKGSLMARASLAPDSYNIQINALPLAPSSRDGQIESIGRLDQSRDTDDLPGRMQNYGGDTTDKGYCTYPDLWLRMQRQGDKFTTYFANTNTTDFPAGWASNPGSTNGWQILTVSHAGTNFPKTLYVGLSTVAHNNDINDTTHTVTSRYGSYGRLPATPILPTSSGAPVTSDQAPGAYPNSKVLAVNWDASLPANGLGYPGDIVQSAQGAPQQIVWNSGGFGTAARDVIVDFNGETPGGFSVARYQCGAFDFLINPRDPAAAGQNLGPYSNPLRERFAAGSPSVPASQAWTPSPNLGFVFTTVRKNGQGWNDQSPSFYASSYVQLDGVATGAGYDPIGGHFRGGQFYTRTTKLVTGDAANGPASGSLQRCAVPISVFWFPYDQGWKAGYLDDATLDIATPGTPHWKRGDGWGLNSGTALTGYGNPGGQNFYNSPKDLLTWVDTTGFGTYSGLGTLKLKGVNSLNDGMLFTVGNDENNSIRGPLANNAPLADGSGWTVAIRDLDTSRYDPSTYATKGASDAGSSFSFVYIPFNSDNLVGARVKGSDGSVIKGAGSFTVTRLSAGRYALTIPGKTGSDGALMLQTAGYLADQPTLVDTSVLSYEYGGTNTPANAFIIESRYVDATAGGEGVVTLRDADFSFVWVDFQNPLSPPGSTPPVLSIVPAGNNTVKISWTGGAGYNLQSTTSLSGTPNWTPLGSQNPQTVTVTAGPQFFRVVSP